MRHKWADDAGGGERYAVEGSKNDPLPNYELKNFNGVWTPMELPGSSALGREILRLAEREEALCGVINATMTELGLPAGSCEDEFLEAVTRLAERVRELEGSWRCFHCGEVFTDAEKAREHFGDREKAEAVACVLETTHPLVIRLRVRIAALEEENARLRPAIEKEKDRIPTAAYRRIIGGE